VTRDFVAVVGIDLEKVLQHRANPNVFIVPFFSLEKNALQS
jgi:hypothetical protein